METTKRKRDISCNLPHEIMAQIFEEGTFMPKNQDARLPFQHLVSSVNRCWRLIALSAGRLWATVVFKTSSAIFSPKWNSRGFGLKGQVNAYLTSQSCRKFTVWSTRSSLRQTSSYPYFTAAANSP